MNISDKVWKETKQGERLICKLSVGAEAIEGVTELVNVLAQVSNDIFIPDHRKEHYAKKLSEITATFAKK